MNIILGAAIVGLILQYFLDFFNLREKVKRIIGAVILVVTIIILVINDISQSKTNEQLTSQLISLDSNYSALQTKFELNKLTLDNIRVQNDSLLKKIDPFLLIAKTKYPNLSNDQALQKLEDEFQSLRIDLENEKSTIKQITAEMEIEFRTLDNINPTSNIISGYERYNNLTLKSIKTNFETLFWCYEPFKVVQKKENYYAFISRMSVKDGLEPIGLTLAELKDFDYITIQMPIFGIENKNNTRIFVQNVRISIYINGSERILFKKDLSSLVNLVYNNGITAVSFGIPLYQTNGILSFLKNT